MNRPRRTTAAAAGAVVLATSGGLLAAAGPASAAVTCASPVFKRTFYANTTFSGTPKGTDCDSVIDQNWGTGAPGYKGMPANNFGVRWSTTRDFGSGGPFTFTASSRDGIRVYLDGVRKVDMWKNVATTVSKTVNVTIPSGKHSLRVDFVNWTGAANVKFAYTPALRRPSTRSSRSSRPGPPPPTARRPRPRRSAGPRTRRWTSPGTACTGG